MQGLDDLRAALHRLPGELVEEARVIVHAQAEDVGGQIQRDYPTGPTGNLKRMVTVVHASQTLAASSLVRSRAPHANIFEHGTKRRTTGRGFNRGAMPQRDASQLMIPKVIRARQRMMAALIALVRRAGFEVRA
jgi:hypothetical protein